MHDLANSFDRSMAINFVKDHVSPVLLVRHTPEIMRLAETFITTTIFCNKYEKNLNKLALIMTNGL